MAARRRHGWEAVVRTHHRQRAAMRAPGAGAGRMPGAGAPGWGAARWHAGHVAMCQRDGAIARRRLSPRAVSYTHLRAHETSAHL
eukprot:4446848-Alexandrium_andersonii.AAC.1